MRFYKLLLGSENTTCSVTRNNDGLSEVDKKRSLDSAEADSACFLRMRSLRTFFVGGAEEETFFSSNMPICYYRIRKFAESRRSRSWILLWFTEERTRSKTFRSRNGRGVKKMRLCPSLLPVEEKFTLVLRLVWNWITMETLKFNVFSFVNQ